MIQMLACAAIVTVTGLVAAPVDASPIVLDFDVDASGQPIQAGQFIDNEYAAWGVDIHARATNGINQAIAFDSANPTGNDSDLVTPGYHASNTAPLGNILILPKDVRDADHDGYVDDPDDHAGRPAGWFALTYDRQFTAASVTLLDVERQGGRIQLVNQLDPVAWTYDLVEEIHVPGRGDNSVQTLSVANTPGFEAMLIRMVGSGAVDNVAVDGPANAIPEPATAALFACGLFLMMPRRRRTPTA